ncbi:transient receptor potential cation channel subfamily V member 1 [Corythoichthys intestinalis]|uniref:transient receptor potential cation channel subfamily V member 1 n=1 Tax=Corythoichthys intestinalis TaxID=161448 RepID=UPI0025A517A3|nr:transient receptor potential cation channel subfamily V member 1 [Corythoichthys intestinalis]XP_061801365.1 transient receptor potential cation channel subfamily V member 1-like [Nerophis lumbriciformis]
MKKSEKHGFSLEADDRTEAEKCRRKSPKQDVLGSVLRVGQQAPKAPMDTDYQEEMEESKPQIRFNLNFDKGIRGVDQDNTKRDGQTFDINRLFEAAARGDVSSLEGLSHYLHQNMKKLTDSLYQSYGKTALMKALLHLRDGKNPTVEFLLEVSERTGDIKEFVNAAYTDYDYKGQTALHIAIERRSLSYVKLLLSKGADVHAKALGKFFQPHDGPNFYFGELPLSLAACTNQPDMVEFLLDNQHHQASPNAADSQGNTVLHALVVVADNTKENTDLFITSMYDLILTISARLRPKLNLEEIENNNGLTPLKLAAKTGKSGLFAHILKREFQESHTKHLSRKFTEWVYGPVQSSLYDLASVDSVENNSVLEILVYGSDIPNRHVMLQTEPLRQLLEDKWKRFAGRMFGINFLVYLGYLIIFTVVAYNKKEGKTPFPLEHSVTGYLYISGQLLITVANCYFFFIGLLDMKRKRPKLQTLLIDGYYDILFFVQAVLFLAAASLYITGRQEYLGFLVLCLALSWVNLLYFARGSKQMGIYSVMIQKMILSDILRFLFVYFVFLFGFSAAVVTLLIEPPARNITNKKGRLFGPLEPESECIKPTFRNISYTTLQLFKFTIGMGDMEFTEHYQYKEVFYVLLIFYIILTYILLLNMLIALMNRTVEKITMESTSIWKLQRGITILDMEKRLPFCARKRLRSGVDKNLGTSSEQDQRRCFRVEEVNWNKWNIHLGKIHEEPGYWDRARRLEDKTPIRTNKGRSWRGLFAESIKGRQSTEMSNLAV